MITYISDEELIVELGALRERFTVIGKHLFFSEELLFRHSRFGEMWYSILYGTAGKKGGYYMEVEI